MYLWEEIFWRINPCHTNAGNNLKIALSMQKNWKSEENDRKRLEQ
jgi:hypothetical protein